MGIFHDTYRIQKGGSNVSKWWPTIQYREISRRTIHCKSPLLAILQLFSLRVEKDLNEDVRVLSIYIKTGILYQCVPNRATSVPVHP